MFKLSTIGNKYFIIIIIIIIKEAQAEEAWPSHGEASQSGFNHGSNP